MFDTGDSLLGVRSPMARQHRYAKRCGLALALKLSVGNSERRCKSLRNYILCL
jgi:hypothetical protein